MHLLINRQTLKGLDLDSIIRRNLLFDAGLQFRPTSGRHKHDLSDKYWSGIAQELQTGCTYVSFYLQWKPHDLLRLRPRPYTTSTQPHLMLPSPSTHTSHALPHPSPSHRIFLEVLLFVTQPLTSILLCGTYANPATLQMQIEQHTAPAAHLRSLFDLELIQQELHHQLFDP
ncbi:uncharacterized protein F5147DRAFT_774671 [Suillus discolor]|uniref:Uncharacterized protein n=1 Tax=Suillus discolor TaxID=1912936 RepID=A0A9P7F4M7_9AGAM|nr:uncharacterized protein F5147DRAFT_774671 [Suillus discolor]KAG2106679.1 hypothetical protein F5147DRAFT_774671 [Suillus discolor]